jgi:hypothetical protein
MNLLRTSLRFVLGLPNTPVDGPLNRSNNVHFILCCKCMQSNFAVYTVEGQTNINLMCIKCGTFQCVGDKEKQ